MFQANGEKSRVCFTRDAQFAVSRVAGKPVTLVGYAMKWNVPSEPRGYDGYTVTLMPNSVKLKEPTLALYAHDTQSVLGNSANGTLRTATDAIGLRVEIDLPDTTLGRDVAELVDKRYVAGMSFSMLYDDALKTEQIREGDTLIEMKVMAFTCDEVTVCVNPGFPQTTVAVKPEPLAQHAADRPRTDIEPPANALADDQRRLETARQDLYAGVLAEFQPPDEESSTPSH